MHHVRKVGNLGAPASDEHVSEDEAGQIMAFITQLLRNLFEIPGELKLLEVPATEEV